MSKTIHIYYDQEKNKFVLEKELPNISSTSSLLHRLDERALLISTLAETLNEIEAFKISATEELITWYEGLVELMKDQEQKLQQLEEKASYLKARLNVPTFKKDEKVSLSSKTRLSPTTSSLDTELTVTEIINMLLSERG